MSKTLTVALILIFLTASAITLPSPVKAASKTIIVPDDYPTISSAIDAAKNNTIILVRNGMYEEQTLIKNKTISLIGEGAEKTRISCRPQWVFTGGFHLNGTGIQPDYGYDSPIKITGNNVKFSGFKVISDKSISITLSGTASILTANNITTPLTISGYAQNVTGNCINSGILVSAGEKHIISNNQIIDGLYTLAAQSTITNNTFSGDYGIMLGSFDNTVYNNTIQNTDCALYFWMDAADNAFYGNNFINNSIQVQIGDVYNSTVAKWDNDEVGNYWSNYAGQGNYVIDQNNIDHYPLTEPYHFTKTPEPNTPITLIAIATAVALAVFLSLLFIRKHKTN